MQLAQSRIKLNCSVCLSRSGQHDRALTVARDAFNELAQHLDLGVDSHASATALQEALHSLLLQASRWPASGSCEALRRNRGDVFAQAAAAAHNVACELTHLSCRGKAGANTRWSRKDRCHHCCMLCLLLSCAVMRLSWQRFHKEPSRCNINICASAHS